MEAAFLRKWDSQFDKVLRSSVLLRQWYKELQSLDTQLSRLAIQLLGDTDLVGLMEMDALVLDFDLDQAMEDIGFLRLQISRLPDLQAELLERQQEIRDMVEVVGLHKNYIQQIGHEIERQNIEGQLMFEEL